MTAWLWGIAIRRLVSRLRGRRDALAPQSATAASGPSAEEQVLLSVEYGDLGTAMAALSPPMRAVMQAVVLDGLTTKEARAARRPKAASETHLAHAKARMRTALAEGVS